MSKQKKQNNAVRNRIQPVPFPRTRRPDTAKVMTSCKAGKVYPAGFIPLYPEDAIISSGGGASTYQIAARMEETEKLLANGVNMRMHAYFVSYAALDRFDGVESVMNAWAGYAGSSDIVETDVIDTSEEHAFYNQFGVHVPDGALVNSLYRESYNLVINYRRKLVSESLPVRLLNDFSMSRALWGQTAIARIVPTFDEALIEGEFSLGGAGGNLPVKGLRVAEVGAANAQGRDISETNVSGVNTRYQSPLLVERDSGVTHSPVNEIYAELDASGFNVSLATIDQAKMVQSFARIRQQFSGHDEELIDLMMKGLQIPNTAYRDPIHMGSAAGSFGYNQRYATDAANLDTYVSNGVLNVSMPLRLPKQPTGGVVVLLYEIIPEPVFDRQSDMFLTKDQADFPDALRDTLDIQQVDVVPNKFVDALHTVPDGTFGYAPMNYDSIRQATRVGGRFLRTLTADASAEDQQHIWSVRTVDPVLDEDAFLVPDDLAHNVFQDTSVDPFIIQIAYGANIEGITQFGPTLFEASGDYDAVAAVAPTDSISP